MMLEHPSYNIKLVGDQVLETTICAVSNDLENNGLCFLLHKPTSNSNSKEIIVE